jgi:hypothetical protein
MRLAGEPHREQITRAIQAIGVFAAADRVGQ